MHHRSCPIKLTVSLPAADYRLYESAARILRRIMRDQAPDVLMLIQAKLLKQDATGLAEDYLDLVGWPHAERRVILPRRAAKRGLPAVRLTPRAPTVRVRRLPVPGRSRLSPDPSRN